MESANTLAREHEMIVRVVSCLERAVEESRSGGRLEEELLSKVLDFAQGFIHRSHQAREEIFYRHLAGWTSDGGGALEHSFLREFVAAMSRVLPEAARGGPAAARMFRENATAYVGLMRSHLKREDMAIAEISTMAVPEREDRELMSRFAAVDRSLGEDGAERYFRLAQEIEKRWGRQAPSSERAQADG
jgi:hemerythrin-like domain-containing protein